MKLSSFMIGVVLFASIASALFGVANLMGEEYQSDDFQDYGRLATTYEKKSEQVALDSNSIVRTMEDQTDQAEFTENTEDRFFGPVDSAKRGLGAIGIYRKLINTTQHETSDIVDPIVWDTALSIAVILFAIIVVGFIWRAKLED